MLLLCLFLSLFLLTSEPPPSHMYHQLEALMKLSNTYSTTSKPSICCLVVQWPTLMSFLLFLLYSLKRSFSSLVMLFLFFPFYPFFLFITLTKIAYCISSLRKLLFAYVSLKTSYFCMNTYAVIFLVDGVEK